MIPRPLRVSPRQHPPAMQVWGPHSAIMFCLGYIPLGLSLPGSVCQGIKKPKGQQAREAQEREMNKDRKKACHEQGH